MVTYLNIAVNWLSISTTYRQQDKCKTDTKRGHSHLESLRGLNSSEKQMQKIIKVIYGGGSLEKDKSYS